MTIWELSIHDLLFYLFFPGVTIQTFQIMLLGRISLILILSQILAL